ncbi:MAG: hypothetical protein ACRD07_05095 [Acidimicrobiales bacterium]
MDARTRKLAGWVIVAIGVIIAVVGALADQIGVGEDEGGGFGGRQVAVLVVGLVIAAIGVAVALWRPGSREPTPTTSQPEA